MDGELYAVTIDVDALLARLTTDCCGAMKFLRAAGFTETRWPGVWVGGKTAIEQLEPDEVVSLKPMGT